MVGGEIALKILSDSEATDVVSLCGCISENLVLE